MDKNYNIKPSEQERMVVALESIASSLSAIKKVLTSDEEDILDKLHETYEMD